LTAIFYERLSAVFYFVKNRCIKIHQISSSEECLLFGQIYFRLDKASEQESMK